MFARQAKIATLTGEPVVEIQRVTNPRERSQMHFQDLADLVSSDVADGGEIAVEMPFTGETIADLPACGAGGIARILERAREAQRIWQRTSARERSDISFASMTSSSRVRMS